MRSERQKMWTLAGSVSALALAMISALMRDPSGTIVGTLICIMLMLRHLNDRRERMLVYDAAVLIGLVSLSIGDILLLAPMDAGGGAWLDLFVLSRSVALFAAGTIITTCTLMREKLGLNPFMFVTTIYLTANLLLSICVLGLLLFDYLSGHVLIVDNRWMMFIISDMFLSIGIFALLLLIFRGSIPMSVHGGTEA